MIITTHYGDAYTAATPPSPSPLPQPTPPLQGVPEKSRIKDSLNFLNFYEYSKTQDKFCRKVTYKTGISTEQYGA